MGHRRTALGTVGQPALRRVAKGNDHNDAKASKTHKRSLLRTTKMPMEYEIGDRKLVFHDNLRLRLVTASEDRTKGNSARPRATDPRPPRITRLKISRTFIAILV